MDAATLLDHYIHDLANIPEETKYLLSEIGRKDVEYDKIMSKIQAADSQISKYIKQHGSLVRHPKEDSLNDEMIKYYEEARKISNEKILLSNTALLNISKYVSRFERDIERLVESGGIDHWDYVEEEDIDMIDAIPSTGNKNSSFKNLDKPYARSYNGSSNSNNTFNDPKKIMLSSNGSVSELTKKMINSSLESKSQKLPKKSSRDKTPINDNASTRESTPSMRKKDMSMSTPMNKGPSRRIPSGSGMGNNENGNGEDDELYCFCQQVSYGEMVACDNPNCKYEWFHYDCVGLKEPPSGVWFCPDCRKDGKKDFPKREKKKK
ncbi:histone acetyltransferase [Pichia kluyveri]|uniref:Chromatin modification-related protein n=1 Tax=Pichia kluyveri TaxID=36015 RepID=A0AAV5RB86_PICKL|nr:histone acetyltransferase [Pichia kluyveri]